MAQTKKMGRPKKKDQDKFSVPVHCRINSSVKEDLDEMREWYKNAKKDKNFHDLMSPSLDNGQPLNGHLFKDMVKNTDTSTSESEFIRLLLTLGIQSMNFYQKLLIEGWRCPICGKQRAISEKVFIKQLTK